MANGSKTPTYYTGTASDVERYLKDTYAQTQGVKTWEDLLTSAYADVASEASASMSYDISNAYANFKRQQLAAQSNQNIMTGYAERIGEDLTSAYGSAVGEIEQDTAAAVSKAIEAVNMQYGDIEKRFAKDAKYVQDVITQAQRYYMDTNASSDNVFGVGLDRYGEFMADEANRAALFNTILHDDTQIDPITGLSGFYSYLRDTSPDTFEWFAGERDTALRTGTQDVVSQYLGITEDVEDLSAREKATWLDARVKYDKIPTVDVVDTEGKSSVANLASGVVGGNRLTVDGTDYVVVDITTDNVAGLVPTTLTPPTGTPNRSNYAEFAAYQQARQSEIDAYLRPLKDVARTYNSKMIEGEVIEVDGNKFIKLGDSIRLLDPYRPDRHDRATTNDPLLSGSGGGSSFG